MAKQGKVSRGVARLLAGIVALFATFVIRNPNILTVSLLLIVELHLNSVPPAVSMGVPFPVGKKGVS